MCETKPLISYEDFVKLDLRVAKVLEASNHPNADKLICLKIDLGNEHRQIIAGLRGHYEPAECPEGAECVGHIEAKVRV